MGGYCNANRKIYLANTQDELIQHVNEEIHLLKTRLREIVDEEKKGSAAPAFSLRINMIPSCELMSKDLAAVKIPESHFDDAKKLFNDFYNYVEDDDYENAIRTKNEIYEKCLGKKEADANQAKLVPAARNETKADEDEVMNKPKDDIKA